MKKSLLLLAAAPLVLTGCYASNTVYRALPDQAGLVSYECGSLEGDIAEAAADNSHRVFVRSHYSKMVAQQNKIDRLRAAGNSTQAEIRAVNAETTAIRSAAEIATAEVGCEVGSVRAF